MENDVQICNRKFHNKQGSSRRFRTRNGFLGFLHSFTSVAMVSRVGACDRWGGAESGQTRRRSRDGARVARAG